LVKTKANDPIMSSYAVEKLLGCALMHFNRCTCSPHHWY